MNESQYLKKKNKGRLVDRLLALANLYFMGIQSPLFKAQRQSSAVKSEMFGSNLSTITERKSSKMSGGSKKPKSETPEKTPPEARSNQPINPFNSILILLAPPFLRRWSGQRTTG